MSVAMFIEQTTFYGRLWRNCHITVCPSVCSLANLILTTQANCITKLSKVTGWSFLTLATDRMFVKEASIPSKWMLQEYVGLCSDVCTNCGTAKRKFGISCKCQCHFELFVLILLNLKFNPLKTKRSLLYLKTQSVPRCKHFSSPYNM